MRDSASSRGISVIDLTRSSRVAKPFLPTLPCKVTFYRIYNSLLLASTTAEWQVGKQFFLSDFPLVILWMLGCGDVKFDRSF